MSCYIYLLTLEALFNTEVKHALEPFSSTTPRIIIYATFRGELLGETAAKSAEALGIRACEALFGKKLGPLLIAEGLGRRIEAGFFFSKKIKAEIWLG